MSWPFQSGSQQPDWRSTKLRSFLARRKRTNCQDLPLLSVNLPEGVVKRQKDDGRVAPPSDLSGYQEVRPNDLVMNQLGKPHGALGVSNHHGIISPAYFVAEISKEAEPRFVHHLLRTRLYISEYERRGKYMPPSQFDISWEQFRDISVTLPPLAKQREIADYLDTETARIDALISKKRRLIDLLAEHRTALITQTVTKGLPPTAAKAAGLPPNPPLKPTAIPWLGSIPTHWQVRHLGSIGSFFKGGGGTKADEVEGGLPCVRYGDLYTQHEFVINSTRTGIAEEAVHDYRLLQYGDVLFAGSGETIEEIGKSAVNLIEGRVYCGGDVIVFRPEIEIDATFLGYAADCQPSTYQKACMGRGVTVMHIYSSELKRLLIPLPPLSEQRAIAAFLDRQSDRIDTLSDLAETAIDRLQEYRTALITAAVAGGISMAEVNPTEFASDRSTGKDP